MGTLDRILLRIYRLEHLNDLLDLPVLLSVAVLAAGRSNGDRLLLVALWHSENVLMTLNNL